MIIITGIVCVVVLIIFLASRRLLIWQQGLQWSNWLCVGGVVGLIACAIIVYCILAQFMSQDNKDTSQYMATVFPPILSHNYKNQQIYINGDENTFNETDNFHYRVEIGKIKMQTARFIDGERKRTMLLCQLPKKPRLKPNKVYYGKVKFGKQIVAKFQIEVEPNPMADIWGSGLSDKILSLSIYLIVVFVLVAIVLSIRKGIKAQDSQNVSP